MTQNGREHEPSTSDEDVPPLEDMTAHVQQAREIRSRLDVGHAPSKPQPTGLREHPASTSKRTDTRANDAASRKSGTTRGESFGGLRKGFLLSSREAPTNRAAQGSKVSPGRRAAGADGTGSPGAREGQGMVRGTAEEVPTIRSPGGGATGGRKRSGLELPEVQEAMKESLPLLDSQDWVTSDLISKIEQSPVLSNALRDPQLAQVLAQFQANPQATMAAAGNNPKLQHFLSEFCTLMGDHFTALADDEEKAKVVGGVKQGGGGGDGRGKAASKPLISEIPSQADDAAPGEDVHMRAVLSNPEVQGALMDKDVQAVILALKSNPDKAHSTLQTASDDLRKKVDVLVKHGILGFQHF